MDAAPSFGVSIISEVPSNPQLTFYYENYGLLLSELSTSEIYESGMNEDT